MLRLTDLSRPAHDPCANDGVTLIELLTVIAVIAVIATMAWPSIGRFLQSAQIKSAATGVASALKDVREAAISSSTPHLVIFHEAAGSESTDGSSDLCGSFATVVSDFDHSFTLTSGDKTREIAFASGPCEKVKSFGDEGAPEQFAEVKLPTEDSGSSQESSTTAITLASTTTDDAEDDACEDGSRLGDAAANSSTFPVDPVTGEAVLAFDERGVAVDPSSPRSWGSGAGAFFMTDGENALLAAIVYPMGNVVLRTWSAEKRTWE